MGAAKHCHRRSNLGLVVAFFAKVRECKYDLRIVLSPFGVGGRSFSFYRMNSQLQRLTLTRDRWRETCRIDVLCEDAMKVFRTPENARIQRDVMRPR